MTDWKEQIQKESDKFHGGTAWREPSERKPSYEPYSPSAQTRKRKASEPWFLSCLPCGYSLGGLIDVLDFSRGFYGKIQKFERQIGAILTDNNVTGFDYPPASIIYKRLPDKLDGIMESFRNSLSAKSIAFHLFHGHLKGISLFQDESGLKLLQWISDKSRPAVSDQRINLALQIQTAYFCLSQKPLIDGRQFLERNGLFLALSSSSLSSNIEVPFPEEKIIFPFFTPEAELPVFAHIPAALANGFENIIAQTTLERLEAKIP